jgi:hypothetical protein
MDESNLTTMLMNFVTKEDTIGENMDASLFATTNGKTIAIT